MTIPGTKNPGDPGHVTDHNHITGELTTLTNTKTPTTRTITAGPGLTGGGTLAADRTLQIDLDYIHDQVNQLIAAGANITKNYDDDNGTLTISATGSGTSTAHYGPTAPTGTPTIGQLWADTELTGTSPSTLYPGFYPGLNVLPGG